MYTLDTDILAILLAIISFVIPAITAIREKKKKGNGQQQETINESPDEQLHKQDVEELFNELLGLQIKVDGEETVEDDTLKEQSMPQEYLNEQEMQQEAIEALQQPAMQPEYMQEGVHAVAETVPEEEPQMPQYVEDVSGETAKSLKERVKANPKDMVLFAEILKPKFKEFEN